MLNNNPKGEVFPVVHIAHVRDDLFVRTGLFRGERGLKNSFYNVGQALKNTKTSLRSGTYCEYDHLRVLPTQLCEYGVV